jgi:hypothetical protein
MFRKLIKLMKDVREYMSEAETTLLKFNDLVKYLLKNGMDEHLEVQVEEISEKEQNCDDLRRSLEYEMFSRSLLPETREDLMEIIEKMDEIPNHCKLVADMIVDQHTEILDSLKDNLLELIKINMETFKMVVEAVDDCFGKMLKTTELSAKIDESENKAKEIERKMIRSIFTDKSLETHPGGQLVQKEVVKSIAQISGKCKHLSERITITAIKRKV